MTTGFYQSFENLHRGNEEDVATRLGTYQNLLDTLHEILPGAPALDLGCGRGEWLTTLKNTGFEPVGVDTDQDMLATCQAKGLSVTGTDALSFLQQAPDNHYGIVSAFHLVEHVPFDVLKSMLEQAYRVIQPGGLLLLETPNPENPIIGACYFYMDPTHVKPLPPGLLQFVADYSGFQPSCVWRVNEKEGLRNNAPSLSTVFKASSPDYAVIAQKPGHEDAGARLQPLFREIQGITLDELATRYDNQHRETAERLERSIHAEVDYMGAKITEELIKRDHQIQTLIREQQALHQLTDTIQARLQHQEALLRETRHLQAVHDEKIRSLAIFTRILHPIYRATSNSRHRLLNARQASRNGVFYQWQMVKLLKILGLSKLAETCAARAGLTLQGTPIPVSQQPAGQPPAKGELIHTGPLNPIPMALVRVLSNDNSFQTISVNAHSLSVCIEGHFSGSYSLAAVNRTLAIALLNLECSAVTLIPREGERTKQIHSAPERQLEQLRPLIASREVKSDIAIYHHFPIIENPDPTQGTPVLLFFWEESLVPEHTIDQINQHYAGVLVTSWVVKKALIDSGCARPIALIPLPMDDSLKIPITKSPKAPFRFLHVSSCFPRKGADVLLNAFRTLLERHQDLELVIKTFPNPHNTIEQQIEECIPTPLRSRVKLILDEYDDSAMDTLYRSGHAIVLPSRGEGLNLPAIEATRYGLPVVTTGYGAHTDFLQGSGVHFVNYRFAPSGSHLHTPGSLWVDPDQQDLEVQCEAVLDQLRTGTTNTEDTRRAVTNAFFTASARTRLVSNLQKLINISPNRAKRPIVFMTTWGEACGIAEYSRYLTKELLEQGATIGIWAPKHLRNPDNAPLAKRLSCLECCWQPQDHHLPPALATADETIWIQYHPGFFALNKLLGDHIETATRAGKLRFITLHATLPLLQLTKHERKQAAVTLSAFYRVIVHTPADMNVLKELGIADNVALLPQGVTAPAAAAQQPQTDAFTVGCFGFLFPHKGVLELIDAFADFLNAQPKATNARLLLLNSVHTSPTSADYEKLCRQRIREQGIEAVTTFCSDFLEENEIAVKLASCNLLVLPYRETPESSSAAVRTAVACCPTVAVTPAAIFTEVRDATLTLPGFESSHIRRSIEHTWTGQNDAELIDVHRARDLWLTQHQWSKVAQRHSRLIDAATTDSHWQHREANQ